MSTIDSSTLANATKWSTITEIVAKLILPITNMVLARLLTPEAFGVVATITMIITFAEIFTDAGFQKYLIQHEFKDDRDKDESTNVAFWSNLTLSLFLWLVIGIFAEPLARVVGNPGLGDVITIACLSIPLAAFSSIQMALYRRAFDFKTLFKVRIAGIMVPIVVTIPLALITKSFWALVIGTIVTNIVNAIVLTYYSTWKPRLFYSFAKLKEMLSFSIWSMIEAITIWMTGYIDIFIIGVFLNEYLLGVYKTSMTTVGQITALITSATTPILFSALSRLQNNRSEFEALFFKFQKMVGLLVIPLGVGIFCFKDLITQILLGGQWGEAANFIGLWGLTSALTIVLSHYSSEVYRSIGRPKLSALAQFLHIIVLCPAMLIAVDYDWETVYVTRSLVRLQGVIVSLIIMKVAINISTYAMVKNIMPSVIASVVMGGVGVAMLTISPSIIWAMFSLLVCVGIYLFTVTRFNNERQVVKSFIQQIKHR